MYAYSVGLPHMSCMVGLMMIYMKHNQEQNVLD